MIHQGSRAEDDPRSLEPRAPNLLDDNSEQTQSIDLRSLVPEEVTVSGSFDFRKVKHASFGKLLEAISIPTFLVARSHTLTFANSAFFKMAGGNVNLKAVTFASLFPTPRAAREAQLLLERVFREREPQVRETKLRVSSGEIWGRLHLSTIRLSNQRMVMAQVENLTAEKELLAVRKYKKLVNLFPIGIAEFALPRSLRKGSDVETSLKRALDARLVDGNDEFARVVQCSDISRLTGSGFHRLFPAHGKGLELIRSWIEKGCPICSFNTREGGGNGAKLHFENTLIGNASGGRILGFWWLKRDISEKKRTEEEILRSQKLESLGILAGGIAHDFNNLLTAVLGNISLTKNHIEPNGKAGEKLEAAAKATSHAQQLTRQLLTFSKGGKPITKLASVSELLREWAGFVLRGSSVALDIDIPDDLWNAVMDEGQIGQVVNNLILNASQAMPNGGVVSVSAENTVLSDGDIPSLPAGMYVKVVVSDTGEGIPEEMQRQVFDPYFTTKTEGAGLGLATSYSIIRKHGGLLTLASEPGKGTSVTFHLPASLDVLSEEGALRPALSRGAGRILVMDDEECIRDMLGELLQSLGYSAEFAEDGERALEVYAHARDEGRPFDAVIMDLTIPGGMGGREAIRRLKAVDPDIKAIVSSGYSNDPVMADFTAFGFSGILPKPYNAAQLSAALADVLAQNAPNGRPTDAV